VSGVCLSIAAVGAAFLETAIGAKASVALLLPLAPGAWTVMAIIRPPEPSGTGLTWATGIAVVLANCAIYSMIVQAARVGIAAAGRSEVG